MTPYGAMSLGVLLIGLNVYGLLADYRNHPQLKLWFRLVLLTESSAGVFALTGFLMLELP